jgi:dihydroflavonol-4-reductase
LVREKRVASEVEYWNNNNKEQNNCVTILPYDMLDGGETLTHALQQACKDTATYDVCIYHIASVFGPSDNHVQTAKDNVKGTEDLVKAVAKFHHSNDNCNCRLIITSSMAAVRGSGQEPRNGKYYTHSDWNTKSELDDSNWGACYQWSKAESEKRAWELAKEHNIPMSSICPSFVFGPPTISTDQQQSSLLSSSSFSITVVGQWLRGESPVQSRLCVDIRDVARAHVAASNVMGERFIVSTEARVPSQDMAEALKRVSREETGLGGDPSKITFDADFKGGAIPIGQREVEATERLQQKLGITLRPVEET